MGVISEGFDLIKKSKEWKDEYEKKHDTNLYIFRITDLNNKLCEENKQLKAKIKELENPEFVLNQIHKEILLEIYKNGEKIDMDEADKLQDNIDKKIAFQELEDNFYICFVNDLYQAYYSFPATARAEILKFIK